MVPLAKLAVMEDPGTGFTCEEILPHNITQTVWCASSQICRRIFKDKQPRTFTDPVLKLSTNHVLEAIRAVIREADCRPITTQKTRQPITTQETCKGAIRTMSLLRIGSMVWQITRETISGGRRIPSPCLPLSPPFQKPCSYKSESLCIRHSSV